MKTLIPKYFAQQSGKFQFGTPKLSISAGYSDVDTHVLDKDFRHPKPKIPWPTKVLKILLPELMLA